MKAKIAILAGLILALAMSASATQIITPGDLNGWAPANVRADATVAITGTQPRSGLGSLEFSSNSITSPFNQDKADFQKLWDPTVFTARTLADLTKLEFEWYRDGSSTVASHFAPVFRLYVLNPTTGKYALLIWERVYNDAGAAPTDAWTTEDILNDYFWMFVPSGQSIPSGVVQNYTSTLNDWITGDPMGVSGDPAPVDIDATTLVFGINAGIGSGWGASKTFLGFVDNLVAEWNSGAETESANFELPPPCTTDCYVDDAIGNDANGGTNPTTDAKKTIQNAVNTVNVSGNVHVASGTYVEQVTINKSLQLLGAGAATTTIKAPATIPIASNPASTVVDVNGAGVSAEITGFTVSGPGPSGCGSIGAGIFVRGGAYADIHDNKILDIRDEPISGCQNGVGIIVGRASFSTTGTADITDNIISGYQKGGIVVSNTGSSANITGNTVTGAGAVTFIAQNGIQVSSGATAEINGNEVSGHSYTPFTFVSTGMLLFLADANTDDNTVSENQVGIYHIEGSGTHQNNEVSASAAGTGSPGFWGIVADPGGIPRAKPAPFDEASASLGKSTAGAASLSTFTSLIHKNTLTGDGGTGGVGLEMDALGTDVLNVTATANIITKWEYGIYLYKDPGATLNANIIDCNQIFDNGAFGVFNSTGVAANAAGNWWGDASGPTHASNLGGTGDVVSDDVTYSPWGTNASCGGSASHNFVFLANTNITIERTKQTPPGGYIHANGKVTFKRGDPSEYDVNVTAVGDVKIIGSENKIDGDVTAGGTVTIDAGSSVTGTVTSGAAVAAIPITAPSFSAGGSSFNIPKSGTLALTPGSYNVVTLNKSATLKLSSGNYYFDQLLNPSADAVIACDVSGGAVNIHVVTKIGFAKNMEIRVTPGDEASSTLVSFITLQTVKFTIEKEGYVLGNLIAPNAVVELKNNTQFRGSICAKEIVIARDCLFYGHASPGDLPGPDLLPKFTPGDGEEESDDTAAEVVTDYELAQNYPNPFNPSTQISFALPEARGEVSLVIYNTNGQLVKTLIAGEMNAGRHRVIWDATDANGRKVASGVYLYVIKAGNFTAQKKLVLTK
jgi:cytoskeletal protein CcmA (bactofilin family)